VSNILRRSALRWLTAHWQLGCCRPTGTHRYRRMRRSSQGRCVETAN